MQGPGPMQAPGPIMKAPPPGAAPDSPCTYLHCGIADQHCARCCFVHEPGRSCPHRCPRPSLASEMTDMQIGDTQIGDDKELWHEETRRLEMTDAGTSGMESTQIGDAQIGDMQIGDDDQIGDVQIGDAQIGDATVAFACCKIMASTRMQNCRRSCEGQNCDAEQEELASPKNLQMLMEL